MGRNAAARAKEFDWDAYTSRALAVLTDLVRPTTERPPARSP
jgi:hypothetical protein